MAHLYLDPNSRSTSSANGDLDTRWAPLLATLLALASVDLLLLRRADGAVVSNASRGNAVVSFDGASYSYRRENGDPLGIGSDLSGVSADAAYDATTATDYPDSVVQIAHLVTSPRSGEILLSAARDWDFRAKYEPIPHVSSHGALHREHMLVPLRLNRPAARSPRRTVDVMPSALAALGRAAPAGLDGVSFL